MTTLKQLKNSIVWSESRKLTLTVYEITSSFPTSETYGISSQMRRASVSINSNIAEGLFRFGNLEMRRFFHIAKASAGELLSQLIIAMDLGYIGREKFTEVEKRITGIIKMLIRITQKLSQ